MSKQLIIVNQDGSVHKLIHRLHSSAKAFDERWLQELLIANPSLLPINEIDESWGRLIPLGREVGVNSGPIDNLYVTSEGMICIVETKLWRNPDASRTVIAQILGYAKDLAKLSFEEFSQTVERSFLFGQKPSFWSRIGKIDLDQVDFQSRLIGSLRNGRFLLLIVGDRIHPEVTLILDVIQSAPNLEFTIRLIEMHFFATDPDQRWPILVMPTVVGKTNEITRAVVKIRYDKIEPEVDVTSIEEGEAKGKTNKIDFEKSFRPQEYVEVFSPIFDKWIADGISINWGLVGFSLGSYWKGRRRSILDIYPDSIALFSEDLAQKRGLSLDPISSYFEKINRVPKAKSILVEGKRYLYYRDVSLEEFKVVLEATDKLVRDYIAGPQ